MSDNDFQKKTKGNFWDLDEASRDFGGSNSKSLLKTTEWGLMTIVSLLASLAFPPYFVAVMSLAFLNAGGLLWVTHLSEKQRQRLREFEVEFRNGHHYEEKEQWVEAVGVYLALKPRYGDIHQLLTLCDKRATKIKKEHPEYFPSKSRLKKEKSLKKKFQSKKKSKKEKLSQGPKK